MHAHIINFDEIQINKLWRQRHTNDSSPTHLRCIFNWLAYTI